METLSSSEGLELEILGASGFDSRDEARPWMGEGEGGDRTEKLKQNSLAASHDRRSDVADVNSRERGTKGRLGKALDPEELQAELREIKKTRASGDSSQGEEDVGYVKKNKLGFLVSDIDTLGWDTEEEESPSESARVRTLLECEENGEATNDNEGVKRELPIVPLDPGWEPSDVETCRSELEACFKDMESKEDGSLDMGRGWASLFRRGGKIDQLASTWKDHLTGHNWDIGLALKSLGKRYFGPHLERDRIMALLFGTKDGEEVVREIEQGGVQVPLKQDMDGKIRRQDLPARVAYGCHKSAKIYAVHVDKKVVTDIIKGWAFAVPRSSWEYIPNLYISPVGAVCQKEKVRVVHDLTFSLNNDTSLNEMVDKDLLPECDIGSVFDRFAERAYGWRLLFRREHLVMRTIDVVDAFRTKMVAPQDMAKFSYIWRGYIIIDTRLQFGYCGAPGHFQRHSSSMTEAHNMTRWDDPSIDKYLNVPIMEHLKIEEGWTQDRVLDMPEDRKKYSLAEEEYNRTKELICDASIYIDDMIQLQVNQGSRLLRSAANSVRVNYEALGLPGQDGQGPLGLKKFGGWSATGTMLGINVDLNKMLFSLPESKLEKLRRILFEQFPRERETATLKEIQSLVGTCRSYAFCIRPGRYFLRRMINVTLGGGSLAHKVILLDEEFHRDMDWWRKIYLLHKEDSDSFSLPIWAHVKVRPDLVVIGDSSGHAGGGVVLGLGIWFRCEWPEDIAQRLNDTNAGRTSDDSEKMTIAHLELAIMVLGVGVMIENMRTKQPLPVLALCDNANAVAWHRRAGARCPKASELIRILGELETRHKVYLNARHLAGVDNTLADEISRRSWEGAKEYMDGGRALVREDEWLSDGESEQVMTGITNHLSWKYSPIPQDLWNKVSSSLRDTISTTRSLNLP
jgi:hypothetical protein